MIVRPDSRALEMLKKRLRMSPELRSLLRHAKNYLTGDVVTGLCALASIAIFTNLVAPAEYGIYQVALSYIGIGTVVLTLNFHGAVSRYICDAQEDSKAFVGTSIVGAIAILLFALLSGWPARGWIATRLDLTVTLIGMIMGFILIRMLKSVYLGICIATQRSRQSATTQAIQAVLVLSGAFASVVHLDGRPAHCLLLGALVGEFIALCIMLPLLRSFFVWAPRAAHLRFIGSFAVPLMPYALSSIVLSQIDRVMIQQQLDAAAAGLYSLAYNIGTVVSMVALSLTRALTPDWFSFMQKKQYGRVDHLIDRMFKITLIVSLLGAYFGPTAAALITAGPYQEALPIVPIIIVGCLFQIINGIYARPISYANRVILIAAIGIFTSLVNVALNYVLIPRYGYVAGAYTTVVSFALMSFLTWFAANFLLKQQRLSPFSILGKPMAVFAIFILYSSQSEPILSLADILIRAVLALLFIWIMLSLAAPRQEDSCVV